MIQKPTHFVPYCMGDRVWLEAKNLTTTHPTTKLAPKCYGPFLVTAAISHTSCNATAGVIVRRAFESEFLVE